MLGAEMDKLCPNDIRFRWQLSLNFDKEICRCPNESSVTVCLPLPKYVEDPLPMGILLTDIMGSLLRLWSKTDILQIINPYFSARKWVVLQFIMQFNFSTIDKTNCTYYEEENVNSPYSQTIRGTTDWRPWGWGTNVLQYNQPINTSWCIQ